MGQDLVDVARDAGPIVEELLAGLRGRGRQRSAPVGSAHPRRPVAVWTRDRDQREVDIILERHNRMVAIEVNATSTSTTHARHMGEFERRLGERFSLGVVLQTGDQRVRLADRIVALPISSLRADRPS